MIVHVAQAFAVRPGIHSLLDMARTVFAESTESVHEITEKYKEQYELSGLKLQYNITNGFYLQLSMKELGDLPIPSLFCQIARKGKNLRFTSPELISMNVKNTEAFEECLILTETVLEVITVDQESKACSLTTLMSVYRVCVRMFVAKFMSCLL